MYKEFPYQKPLIIEETIVSKQEFLPLAYIKILIMMELLTRSLYLSRASQIEPYDADMCW
jgi:hypothetical protein